MPRRSSDRETRSAGLKLVLGAEFHNMKDVRSALEEGADIDAVHPDTGLSALHIAVGNNDLVLCRFLIEECGARFFADGFGRWPTLIAAECQVDDDLSDYIVAQEARYLEHNPHAAYPPELEERRRKRAGDRSIA